MTTLYYKGYKADVEPGGFGFQGWVGDKKFSANTLDGTLEAFVTLVNRIIEQKQVFPCIKCGLCCQNVTQPDEDPRSPFHFPYKFPGGVCEKYDNGCTVYENRPLICNVRAMHEKFPVPGFYSMNLEACNDLGAGITKGFCQGCGAECDNFYCESCNL